MHICHTKVDFIPSDPNGDENERIFEDLNCIWSHTMASQCKAKCVSLSMSNVPSDSKVFLSAWRFLKTLEKNSLHYASLAFLKFCCHESTSGWYPMF